MPEAYPCRATRSNPVSVTLPGQIVTIKQDGVERRVTAAEAFLLYMTKRGLEGDGGAARSAMAAIEEARAMSRAQDHLPVIRKIVLVGLAPGSVNTALQPLRIATKLDRFRPSARIMLEPWLVEAALAQLGKRWLSRAEQTKVLRAVRTPHKVRWPEW